MGDFIVSLPAINIIKNINPNSKIYFASQISKKNAFVRPDTIPINKKIIDEFIFFEYGKINFFKFCKTIKKKNFYKIYYLNSFSSKIKLLRDYFIFCLVGIKNKIGFKYQELNYEKFNETYYLCKRVKKKLNDKDVLIEGYLIDKKKNNKKKYITVSFGGKHPLKKWKQKNWEKLIMFITSSIPKIKIVIVGSLNEYKFAEKLSKKKTKTIVNLCNKTSIKELVDVISHSSYHISHDDGTMHIASTFSKKSVSIFGKSTAAKGKWFPRNPNLKIFYKDKVNDINLSIVKKKVLKDIKSIYKK